MRCVILAFLTVYLVASGVESRRSHKHDGDGKIVGGSEAPADMAPYQVSLQLANGFHYCGGSILTAKVIVTAAHCLINKTYSDIYVRVGSSSYKTGGQRIQVKDGIRHEKYDPKKVDFDIALLLLQSPILYSRHAHPIRLARTKPAVGTMLLLTGWGHLIEGVPIKPDNMHYTKVPVVKQELCEAIYFLLHGVRVTNNMFCAGVLEGGKDTCQGDSGGPAVANDTLYGVVSFGFGCGHAGMPGVYSSVADYSSWIEKNKFELENRG